VRSATDSRPGRGTDEATGARGSLPLEQIDQPSGTGYLCPQSLGPLAKGTIGRHQRHLTRSLGGHGDEHVVTTARCMDNPDAVGHPLLDAAASRTFEDHDNGLAEPTRFGRRANSCHERSGCPGSIAPPPRRPRPDHVRSIDEQHHASLTDPAVTAKRRSKPPDEGPELPHYGQVGARLSASLVAGGTRNL
jgi:hypothetical protein